MAYIRVGAGVGATSYENVQPLPVANSDVRFSIRLHSLAESIHYKQKRM